MANRRRTIGKALLYTADAAERTIDRLWFNWRKRTGRTDPPAIQPYRGYGTEDVLHVSGRVLETCHLWRAHPSDRPWRNLRAMYKRFATREMPGTRIRGQAYGAEAETVTGEEGYFHLEIRPSRHPAQDRIWHDVELEIVSVEGISPGRVTATGKVMIPPVESEFGIISDIDDTVLQTSVTRRWAMLKTTFLRNAHTRLPFEGVAGLYRALQRGSTGSGHNPAFYVSSSPWNLYDLLVEFLDFQGIPQGPLFLRDWGIERTKFIAESSAVHKEKQIERILEVYPRMRFILIGDSGQEDPEIYRDVARRHGDRILAIYIRDVSTTMRDASVNAIAEDLRKNGIDMVLVRDSDGAAEHALRRGFIEPHALVDVHAEKAKDEQAEQPAAIRMP